MRIQRVFTTIAAVVFAAGLFAACGGDDKNDSDASATTTPSGATINLVAKDTSFDQTTLTAKAGEKVTFTLKNDDTIEHNLTIKDLNVDKDVHGGKSGSASATPTAGTYEYHCEYHPTQMKGTLTVS